MKGSSRVLPLFLAPALLFAAQAKQSCPLGDTPMMSPRQQQESAYRAASANAELVSPTSTSSSGRHRSVAIPQRPALQAINFIDTDLLAAMSSAGVVPTSMSSDEEFLRRVSLDLTGQIPDSATVIAFINDKSADKRAKKIDELLASAAFVDRWTMWFGDLVQNVQVSSNSREYYLGRNAYYAWIKDSFKSGKPYDQMVREIIAGKGQNFTSGPSNYWVRQLQPNGPIQDTYDNLAAHSGDKFLGMPLLCLSCHSGAGHLELVNQYLKNKQRSDFWGMASFFSRGKAAGTKYTDPNNPNANLVTFDVEDNIAGAYLLNTTSGNKTPRQPAQGQASAVQPAYMFTGEGPRPGEAWRDAYGRILTADRQFARATVNYVWREMHGVGIVEPPDAFDLARLDPSNVPANSTLQPTNPRLLEDLTSAFIASGFDIRSLLRTIASSSTYQLSSVYTPGAWNESWTPYFARHYPHRLTAEETLDAIAKATNVPQPVTITGIGSVTQAMQFPDTTEPSSRAAVGIFLDEFGRGNRDDSARRNDSSIVQALSMLNNTLVTNRVKKATASSTVAKVLGATTDPASIADQIYLATLSRYPTAAEKSMAINYLKSGNLQQHTEDLQYALLNELEFLFD
jgi:Protein of unknown function (DUF1549)/Protein of unknown function (DUF1553)